jgi:hypothetical protein
MYLPYFRGKQFELTAIRELSEFISPELFRPIIEPVRLNLSPLIRTIKHVNEKEFCPIIVLNPSVGEFSDSSETLYDELSSYEIDYLPCLVISGGETKDAEKLIEKIGSKFAIQISGGADKDSIDIAKDAELVIVDDGLTPAASAQLENIVILRDCFKKKKRNADYLEVKESPFSYLHTTYSNQRNAVGFSDYTLLDSDFSEGGGPAYVVTIHTSYVNTDRFDEIFVRHYSSEDDGTPTDPGGKFADALALLIDDAKPESNIFYQSKALGEFRKLHQSEHFPGLGQVKKLSMEHHIEMVCDYLESK